LSPAINTACRVYTEKGREGKGGEGGRPGSITLHIEPETTSKSAISISTSR